jgi:hypothetical protein
MIAMSKKTFMAAIIITIVLVMSSIVVFVVLYQPSKAKPSPTTSPNVSANQTNVIPSPTVTSTPTPTPMPTPTPEPTLSLNVSLNQTNVIQGNDLQAEVNVTSTGNPASIYLTFDAGSSGIVCSFEPAKGLANYSSLLTMKVPNVTPTGNYSVVLTASSSELRENFSCIVSVLSAQVVVSGRVTVHSYYPDVYLDSISFHDTQTNQSQTILIPFVSINSPGYDYMIALQNEHTYNVVVNFHHGVGSAQFGAITTFSISIFAPAGNSTISDLNLTKYLE